MDTVVGEPISLEGLIKEENWPAVKEQMLAEKTALEDDFSDGTITAQELTRALSEQRRRYLKPVLKKSLGDYKDELAVFVVGADGRKEICPRSDLDIHILYRKPAHKLSAQARKALDQLKYTLEGIGFEFPHAANPRTLADYKTLITSESQRFESWSALLDRDFLWGNKELYDQLDKTVQRFNKKNYSDYSLFLSDKRKKRTASQTTQGPEKEPHLKDSYGGLRDLQETTWLSQVVFECDDLQCLVTESLLTKKEAAALEEASNFFTTMRCHFHLMHTKGEKVLLEYQAELAKRMGYPRETSGDRPEEAIEEMMCDYFRHARKVNFFANVMAAESTERLAQEEHWLIERAPKKIKPIVKKLLGSTQKSDTEPRIRFQSKEPNSMDALRIFHQAQMEGIEIHHSALRTIMSLTSNIDQHFRTKEKANALFMEILLHPDAAQTLRQMQETGFLQKFIPDFEDIDCLMHHDPYHTWTVDEHTFRCIDTLHQLEAGAIRDHRGKAPLATQRFTMVDQSEEELPFSERKALFVAMLLHDIKKGEERRESGSRHSELGADAVLRLGPRLGLNDKETRIAADLIYHHLFMSEKASQGDLQDPDFIKSFAKRMNTPHRLALLTILTTADIMGVGPDTWQGSAQAQSVELLGHYTHSYFRNNEFSMEDDIVLPETYEPGTTHVELKEIFNETATAIQVITPGHPALFARIAGALSAQNCDIQYATARTMDHQGKETTIDRFIVVDSVSGKPLQDDKKERVKDAVKKAITEQSIEDISEKISTLRPRNAKQIEHHPVETKVEVTGTDDKRATINIEASNRLGLLFHVAESFNALGLDIRSANIQTRGPHKAVDTLHVTNRDGSSFSEERRAAIQRHVSETINQRMPVAA